LFSGDGGDSGTMMMMMMMMMMIFGVYHAVIVGVAEVERARWA
jgi:hypothetical protein